MKYVRELVKLFTLFCVGGFTYYMIEVAFRSYSHISMFIVGGLAFVLIGYINIYFTWEMPLCKQCGVATIIILLLEFVSGCILNLWLNLGVWDYSEMPFNILGQIQLHFVIAWYLLSIVGIVLDDLIRWLIFNEEKPRYKLF